MLFPFSLIQSTCGPDLQWTVWAVGQGAWSALTHLLPSLLWLLVLRLGEGRGKRQSSGASKMCLTSLDEPSLFLWCTDQPWLHSVGWMSKCLPSHRVLWWAFRRSSGNLYVYSGLVCGIQERLYISSYLPFLSEQWECSLPKLFLLPLCPVPMASDSLWDKRQSPVPRWMKVSGLQS